MVKCIRGNFVLKFAEFKNNLESEKIFSIYLFEGEDAFFRERGLSLLKKKFITQPDLNFTLLASDCKIEQLISSLNAYPFIDAKRLTLVREFYPKQEIFKGGLNDYLENPSQFSILVILNEKPCELLKKHEAVCVVDCSRADASLIVKWIRGECSLKNVQISPESAKLICDFCLSDMTRIENETKKLCDFVGENGVIDNQTVYQMVTRDSEYKIYEMTDYIAKKKFDLAFSVIKEMLGKGETHQRILTFIYNYFRRLLHFAISDMSTEQLCEAFSLKEFAVKKTKEQALKFKKRALKSAVDALCDADYKIKSGQMNADETMWLAVFKIMID